MLAFVRKKLYSILEREYRSFLFFIFSVVFSLREYIILTSIPSNVFLCNITYDQVFLSLFFQMTFSVYFIFCFFFIHTDISFGYTFKFMLFLSSFYVCWYWICFFKIWYLIYNVFISQIFGHNIIYVSPF